jgi:hypothetical protein
VARRHSADEGAARGVHLGGLVDHGHLLGLGSAALVLITFGWQLRALWRAREVAGLSPTLVAALSGAALALCGYAIVAAQLAFAVVNGLIFAIGAVVLLRWRVLART